MPFYDYKCTNKECEHVMENQLKSFSEKVIPCKECGEEAERLFSGKFAAHGLPNGHIAVRAKKLEN
jgi:putative FmdB family regulatory protein